MKNNTERKIVKFHIGRGGRFFNSGYLTYVNDEKIGEGKTLDSLFYNEEEDVFYQENGNNLHDEFGQAEIDSGIGTVNIDHDYDTTYTTYADELTNRERMAIAKANPYNCAELLGIEQQLYEVLFDLNKLEEFVRNEDEIETLEDIGIYECDEDEYHRLEDEGTDEWDLLEVKGKFYKKEIKW